MEGMMEGCTQLWLIARTFVNDPMYPQHNINKKWRKILMKKMYLTLENSVEIQI
jgi:hypothetical protein